MNRRSVVLLLSGGTLAACAPATGTNPLGRRLRADLTLSRITVTTTGAAFESREAASYASRLGPDLTVSLRQEFSDRLRPEGMVMSVEIQRVNLAGATATAFGRDRSRLQGSVRILDGAGALLASYPVQIEAGAAAETRTGALARAAVSSTDGFYRALLEDFARTAREQVLGADLPGQRLLRRVTAG